MRSSGRVTVTISRQTGQKLGIDTDDSLVVKKVFADGPAKNAGVKERSGWKIFSVAGTHVANLQELKTVMSTAGTEFKMVFTVDPRDGTLDAAHQDCG